MCCNKPCSGPCDACDGNGECNLLQAGIKPSPASACEGAVCDGKGSGCPGQCGSDEDCSADKFCDLATGKCLLDLSAGEVCLRKAQCESGFCVDGVCCTSACTELCQACSKEKKGSGQNGECGFIGFGKDPDEDCPTDDVKNCQFSGACDGKGACSLYEQGSVAEPATCQGSDSLLKARVCDGAGKKTPIETQSCAPFVCDSAAGACKTKCQSDKDCATGAVCSTNGQCTLGEASCADEHTARGADGKLTKCDPYTCLNGQCRSTCATDLECVTGFSCQGDACVAGGAGAAGSGGSEAAGKGGSSGAAGNPASGGQGGASGGAAGSGAAIAPAEEEGACGCRAVGSSSPQGAGALALLALAAAARRRRARG